MEAARRIQLLGLAAMLLSTQLADAQRSSKSLNAPLYAQSLGTTDVTLGAKGSGSQLVVDGEKTPELIPDVLAYRHFLSATSVPPNALPADRKVQRLQLNRVGLSDGDRRTYLATVAWLRQRIGNTAGFLAEQEIAHEARERLRSQLTPEGFQLLDSYIRGRVKRHIKIYASAR